MNYGRFRVPTATRCCTCFVGGRLLSGSPFTVEVVDAGTVLACGEGLVSGQAHHQAVFVVTSDGDQGSFNVGDCRINVYGTQYCYLFVFHVIDQFLLFTLLRYVPNVAKRR